MASVVTRRPGLKEMRAKKICRNCKHWKSQCNQCKKKGLRTGPGYTCSEFVNKHRM